MNKYDLNEMILEEVKNQYKVKVELPEGKQLLRYLHNLTPLTGSLHIMFCNSFLKEGIQLLINAILLYEDGFFDCAFYSVRQAGEVFNTMLYLAENNREEYERWEAKKNFPFDSKIKEQLKQINDGYKEFNQVLEDYFVHHRKLVVKANKIIHKQSKETFYIHRWDDKHCYDQDEELFVEILKYTIGIGIIIYVILEPMSLVMADDELIMKFHFNPMTEVADVDFFEEYLGISDIVDRMKATDFYKEYSQQFRNNEEMNRATYSVIKDNAWDISSLDDIKKQFKLLQPHEKYMFHILKLGVRIIKFYYMGGFDFYFTSYRSKYVDEGFSSTLELQPYKQDVGKFNQKYKRRYISSIWMYEETLMMEHDDPLSEDEIIQIVKVQEKEQEKYKELKKIEDEVAKKIFEDGNMDISSWNKEYGHYFKKMDKIKNS